MLTPATILLSAAGLGLLVAGAEALVRGASRLAAEMRISPLVIGLTVVAYGTSAPELAVSVSGAAAGQTELALGNVVGSNIVNVLLILGAAALVAPLSVSLQLLRVDVPIMIAASVLVLVVGWNGTISRGEGVVLFGGIVAYTVALIRLSRRERAAAVAELAAAYRARAASAGGLLLQVALVVVGLAALVMGARWFLKGAIAVAGWMGVSELVIGLTIVAAGTSLPEVATSLAASLRRERDLCIGNVVGSCIYNVFAVLGLSAIVAPLPVPPAALRFDVPVMIAVAIACLPIFFTGRAIARWEGALFLAYYGAYALYLILAAAQHDALPAFSRLMLGFVVPLTVVTLVALVVRDRRRFSG